MRCAEADAVPGVPELAVPAPLPAVHPPSRRSAGSPAPSVRSQETKDTATTFSALTEDSHDER